jgi:hypothetical protein
MSEDILKKLGLTKEGVRKALGFPEAPVAEVRAFKEINRKYLYGSDQKRVRIRMKEYETFIAARYLEGWHPGSISRILNVSEESVRNKLRKHSLFQKKTVGRPPKSQASLQGSLQQDL